MSKKYIAWEPINILGESDTGNIHVVIANNDSPRRGEIFKSTLDVIEFMEVMPLKMPWGKKYGRISE